MQNQLRGLGRRSGDPIGVRHEDIVQTGGDGYDGAEGDGFGGRLDRLEDVAHGTVDHAGDRLDQGLQNAVSQARAGAQGVARDTASSAVRWVVGGLLALGLVAVAAQAVGKAGER